MSNATGRTDELTLLRRGKVRDIYRVDEQSLLLVATDRVSAYNVILPTSIPGKGATLTAMARWWFEYTREVVPNHLEPYRATPLPAAALEAGFAGRCMQVVEAERIDIECVVRGYLAGTGWKEYCENGTLAGNRLPGGLEQSARLDGPRFTPSIKNDVGNDENISREKLTSLMGSALAGQLESISLALFASGSRHCDERGIILADTKFEFGLVNGTLTLIDEAFTPDSSRFWDRDEWRVGAGVPSFDKQFIRDHLARSGWDRRPPAPELPADVVSGTQQRYGEAARRICGL